MAKKRRPLSPDEPLRHPDHPRPVTRREFIRQGFISGSAMVAGNALLNFFLHPQEAHALSTDVLNIDRGASCTVGLGGNLKIPFIAFDLAGGANFAGSNVLVGKQGGQDDNISSAGYSRLGLPGDRLPGLVDPNARGNGDFTDSTLGLKFHSESALLAGILDKISPATAANIDGIVIPAVSDNDTGNNPHNPMYGIARAGTGGAGAKGSLLSLIGSRATDSGGNSLAPAAMINPAIRPTKIDRPSDVTGLVDTGDLLAILNQADAVRVMEAVARISDAKIGAIDTRHADDATIKQMLRCGYVKAADIAEQFGDPSSLNPELDPQIQAIFSPTELQNTEFRKTASVMKLVCTTRAGAGTITMGGYDYHTGDRIAGETRDIRAGRCIGACLEYAANVQWTDSDNNPRTGLPIMIYIFSDGSVFSNGMDDMTEITDNGIVLPGGKGVWTGDSSATAASLILVYNPNGRGGILRDPTRRQLGYFRDNGSVETAARTPGGFPIAAANSVTALVHTVILNYMALHGEEGAFDGEFAGHGLGGAAALDELILFDQIVNGTIV